MPSSPVIPYNDPTLLFTNAGMNQFKDVFTGQRALPYSRATSSQKCIRAGGKHNDLDNVGFTARHHTFFEMLGNFSFGDYFKEEAISFAWEWITKNLQLDQSRLWVSVYEDDDEAYNLWEKIAPELKNGRITRFGKKDNFWTMGDIGPCGPCSEIHFDRGEQYGTSPQDVVNGETERFVEFWNLVFMQFETLADGTVVDLPKPSVDTGAGLERIATLMQNVGSNYEIDLFQNIITAISDATGSQYKEHITSHHVVADHLRALTFAIADGAGISNEGQGYVLRRILRRASRHGRLLGMEEPFIYKLVPALVNEMGSAFPEIVEKQSHIVKVIRAEEDSFGRTLENGLELFSSVAKKISASGSTVIPGDEVFKLYDTYGFPVDLTEIMATEKGMTIDLVGFEKAMNKQKEQSRSGRTSQTVELIRDELPDAKWMRQSNHELSVGHKAKVLAKNLDDSIDNKYIVLDESPFYIESGGQTHDSGLVTNSDGSFEFHVNESRQQGNSIILFGTLVKGSVNAGDTVTAVVDIDRRWAIMRNHTATHLTHAALREILGDHIKQSGSYVGPDRLRFDFSHHQPMTVEEIKRVEEIVNQQILSATEVVTDEMNIDEARKTGARALFGEKYGETVRVVSVANFSKELCGGTHVDNTAQIGPFFVTVETGIASGVRRIEAITGSEAVNFMLSAKQFRREVAETLGRSENDALKAVKQLRTETLELQKEIKKVKAEMFSHSGPSIGSEEKIGALTFITNDFEDTDRDIMSAWVDSQKERTDAVVAIALGLVNGKSVYIASASAKAVSENSVHVGKLSQAILPKFGGRGGGKPNYAQGGVASETKSQQLFDTVKEVLQSEV